MTQAFTVIKNL